AYGIETCLEFRRVLFRSYPGKWVTYCVSQRYAVLWRSIGQCFDSLAMAVCYARGPARPDRIIGSDPGIGLDVAASLSHPIGTACTVPQTDFYCRSSYSGSCGRGNGVSCSAGSRCDGRYQHAYRTGCGFGSQVSYLYLFQRRSLAAHTTG